MQNKVKGLKDIKKPKLRRKGQTGVDYILNYIIKGKLMFHTGNFKCVMLVLESNKIMSMCFMIIDFKFLTVTISLSHKKSRFYIIFQMGKYHFTIKELRVFKIYKLLLYCEYSEGSRCGKAVDKVFNLKMQSIDQLMMSLGKS